jgi:hypothetical protein
MKLRLVVSAFAMVLVGSGASAQVVKVAELNTRQIRALDRDRTVVFLQGGMLEEHGPYLPAFTDGILSERLTVEVARASRTSRAGPHSCFRRSLSVRADTTDRPAVRFQERRRRPSTLKAMAWTLRTSLASRASWIMVVHVHGSPLLAALEGATTFATHTAVAW